MRHRLLLPALLSLWFLAPGVVTATDLNLAINNGRVIDPESGLDGIRHVGIRNDEIVLVSEEPVVAEREIDATGLVVAPGFIDLHTHSPTLLGQYYQAYDGVTTALELEAGHYPLHGYGGQIKEQPMINFGASAGYVSMRVFEKNGLRMPDSPGAPRPVGFKGWKTAIMFFLTDMETALAASLFEPATEEELGNLQALLKTDLDAGALGVGLALDYFSDAIQSAEMNMIFATAADYEVPVFVHVRRGIDGDTAGLEEVISLARTHNTSVHICHISHNAVSNLDQFLQLINDAQASGLDITTEVLPYNAGSALISSAVFGRDWQTIFNISYEDVEWAATGERFDKAMWEEYREAYPEGQVIHHYLKEAWTRQAVQAPGVIVVSDLLPMESEEKKVAPHNGAFSKVLGRYVREENLLSIEEAIAKMTLLPAQRLESFAPAFKRKGRIQAGKDADITVFDAGRVIDKATYRDPYQEADGIIHVIVNGQVIISDGKQVPDVFPGRRLVATP